MSEIENIRLILDKIGLPKQQQSDLCCLVILSMAGIKPNGVWRNAQNEWTRIHDIIAFTNHEYLKNYAENSRETFRKQALHHFRTAAIVEDNNEATNSPNYRYRLTIEFLNIIRQKGSKKSIAAFLNNHQTLTEKYSSKKKMTKISIVVNESAVTFSSGKHNQLQKLIIEEFATRFAPNSECLYVGDTLKKDLVKNEEMLKQLGFDITLHDKMPDVVLYCKERNWIYFIESVTSVGPMDSKRIMEIEELIKNVRSGKIFVTAFLDFKTYKKFSDSLAWETEVWIADMPDHMIHLNGDKFIGPRCGF